MNAFECITCGYIYYEEKGVPEDGIAPGTKWEDVPDDWVCPDCGLGKSAFKMLKRINSDEIEAVDTTPYEVDWSRDPIIVVGSGLAGYQFVYDYRSFDNKTPIVLITENDGRFYQKPKLSVGFSQNLTADQMVTSSAEEMAYELHIETKPFTTIEKIDPVKKIVYIADEEMNYSRLVLATGSSCRKLPLAGSGVHNVYHVNDLSDYNRLRSALAHKTRVVIIGGGLIGCEYANDLTVAGLQVDVVHPAKVLLNNLMPEEASRALGDSFKDSGMNLHYETRVKSVDKKGRGVLVTLENNETIEADAVISAVGIVPNISLAKSMGLNVNRGIVTDKYLRTSSPDVYALGDCAEIVDRTYFFISAMAAASKVIVQDMLSLEGAVSFKNANWPVKIKTSLCPIMVQVAPRGAEGEWKVEREGNDTVAKFVDVSGNQLGFAYTGKAVKNPEIFDAFKIREEYLITKLEQVRNLIGKPADFMLDHQLDYLDEFSLEFIEKSTVVWMGTTDKDFRCDVSPKGDKAGFVKIIDKKTLLIPDRLGNKLAFGFQNIIQTGQIGLTFLIPRTNECLRVNGKAQISADPNLLSQLKEGETPPSLCTIVTVEESFFHCGKAFMRSSIWNPDSWPNEACDAYTRQLAHDLGVKSEEADSMLTDDYTNGLY